MFISAYVNFMKGLSTITEMAMLEVYWHESFSDIDGCVHVSRACFGIRSGVYLLIPVRVSCCHV